MVDDTFPAACIFPPFKCIGLALTFRVLKSITQSRKCFKSENIINMKHPPIFRLTKFSETAKLNKVWGC